MLTLITSNTAVVTLRNLLNWDHSYVKEVHFGNSQYETEKTNSRAGSTISGESTILRILIALPEEEYALELIAFHVEWCSFSARQGLHISDRALIQRRLTEVDFGAISVKSGCLAYQKVELEAAGADQYYGNQNLFDANGELLEPYNLDWKVLLDDAFRSR